MELKMLNEQVLNSEKIIVYGAGYYGSIVVEYLLRSGLCSEKKMSIAVTKLETDQYIKNIKVHEIQEKVTDEKALVIVAVSKEKQEEIVHELKKNNFLNTFLMNEVILYYMKRNIKYWNEEVFRNNKIVDKLNHLYEETKMYNTDILNEINLNRAISESIWLKRKDFATGGAAVNAKFLYTLYKILDSKKFSSILDIGMGQTTKMISQYVNYDLNAKHMVIESDKEWIDFFANQLEITESTKIVQMDYKMCEFQNEWVRTYNDFKEQLKGHKFDYIVIDAPWGGDMKEYSRIDILDILPECLCDSWIIMFDDVSRTGEKNTMALLREKLNNANIRYAEKIYYGAEKAFAILTSMDNKFFCTV